MSIVLTNNYQASRYRRPFLSIAPSSARHDFTFWTGAIYRRGTNVGVFVAPAAALELSTDEMYDAQYNTRLLGDT